MKTAIGSGNGPSVSLQQQHFQREEFRASVRALLMTPLMSSVDDDFVAVRHQAEALREWFARETGWILQVEREGARLYKRPGNLADATRGLFGYDRRRYVLLCLACAVLEHGKLFAPAGMGDTGTSPPGISQVIVTSVGNWRGEGLALVERVD